MTVSVIQRAVINFAIIYKIKNNIYIDKEKIVYKSFNHNI